MALRPVSFLGVSYLSCSVMGGPQLLCVKAVFLFMNKRCIGMFLKCKNTGSLLIFVWFRDSDLLGFWYTGSVLIGERASRMEGMMSASTANEYFVCPGGMSNSITRKVLQGKDTHFAQKITSTAPSTLSKQGEGSQSSQKPRFSVHSKVKYLSSKGEKWATSPGQLGNEFRSGFIDIISFQTKIHKHCHLLRKVNCLWDMSVDLQL